MENVIIDFYIIKSTISIGTLASLGTILLCYFYECFILGRRRFLVVIQPNEILLKPLMLWWCTHRLLLDRHVLYHIIEPIYTKVLKCGNHIRKKRFQCGMVLDLEQHIQETQQLHKELVYSMNTFASAL